MVRRPTPVAVAASEPLLSPGAAPVTPCPYPSIYPPDPVPVPVRSSLAARFELAQVRYHTTVLVVLLCIFTIPVLQ